MIKSNVRKRKDILPISPTQYQSANSQKTKNASQSLLDNKMISIIEFIIIILLTIAVFYYRSGVLESDEALQIVFNRYNEEHSKFVNQDKELNDLRKQKGNIHPLAPNNEASESHHNKDKDEWNENDKNWIRDIQNNDYKSLRLQYGEEPIHVLIETNFGNIILEMADIQSMPHTLRYFLTLVDNKYWNGCHFFRNANHVIQANCHKRNDLNINGRDDMIKLGQSASIVFQEYDDELPYLHQKYSIGIAGRPGGPDFYVNLVDNKRNHGPGGQGPKPDPCIAHIIEGQDVIDEIHELEHDGSAMMVLKEWVEFKKVSVVKRS